MAYSIMCKKLFVRIFAFILVMLERILGTFFFWPTIYDAQVYELPQSHCGDNWEGTLFL